MVAPGRTAQRGRATPTERACPCLLLQKLVVHQGYNGVANDVGLIFLDSPISNVRPVKLAPAGYVRSMQLQQQTACARALHLLRP